MLHYWTNMLLSSLISLNAPPNLTHGSLIPFMPSDPLFVVLKTSINALAALSFSSFKSLRNRYHKLILSCKK